MDITFLLKKEDISCRRMGYHFEIVSDKFAINFTPDAIEELLTDIENWKKDGWVEAQNKTDKD